ncbi:helix-turn-helix transcriptional regulator [Pseudomonas syringae pv. syringae]|uniref:helix-turn-helix domain-containing protein n=1 Tax=Pseudomonas syringae TaxID=317 RepID=UPI003B00A6A7
MSIFDTAEKRVLSKSELGRVIKHLRELRQWSQDTLAQLARTTDRTIQRIEAGSGASVHTLRALAMAFDFQDIDAFTKPMAIPTDEQLQAAREQFDQKYVMTKALKLESGRDLAKLAVESIGDYIEPAFEPSSDQALAFAELTDYLRDYRDCADHYSSTASLEVYEELQAMIERLNQLGVTLRYATCPVIQNTSLDSQMRALPVGDVLYLVGFREGEAPEDLALPRKMGI